MRGHCGVCNVPKEQVCPLEGGKEQERLRWCVENPSQIPSGTVTLADVSSRNTSLCY